MDTQETAIASAIYARLLGEDLARALADPEARKYAPEMAAQVSRLLKANQPRDAAELLLKAADEQPGNAWIQHRLGIVLRLAKDPQAALRHYRQALLLDSGFPTGIAHYCYTLHLAGESDRAVNILNLRLILMPEDKDSAKIQRMIARALGLRGRPPREASAEAESGEDA